MSAEIATKRKAGRDFHILKKYEAGIELNGTEIKSIRAGKININIADAFVRVQTTSCSSTAATSNPSKPLASVITTPKNARAASFFIKGNP
jgi:tmRNA-binding protein